MKQRLSPHMLGGLIGVTYFIITMIVAFAMGRGDVETTMVIAAMTNIHLEFLFGFLNIFLPVSLASQIGFQLIVGLVINFLLGSLIGWLVGKIVYRKK